MKENHFFFTSAILWSTCLQSFWCEKEIVYSSFGINILLFELKKWSSNLIVSSSSQKLISVHHEIARAPSAKTFTSTKLAFSHFWIWLEHMCGFRTHPRTHHGVRQPILQQKMPFVFACNFGKNQSKSKCLFQNIDIFKKWSNFKHTWKSSLVS